MGEQNRNIVFPLEICEHILSFADGPTLLQAEKVSEEWKQIVERLGKKYFIWKAACLNDMPNKVYQTMQCKCDCEKDEKYEVIYRNWISWQNVSNDEFAIVNSENNFLSNVTCAKISGNHIIYGTLSGSLIVQLDSYEYKQLYEPSDRSMVKNMYFMNNVEIYLDEHMYYQHSHLLVIYEYQYKIFIVYPTLTEISSINFRPSKVSVYDNHICFCDINGYIEVFEINFDSTHPEDLLNPITCFRLYRPIVAESINLFDKVITVVTNSKILSYDYNKSAPKWKVDSGQLLPFAPGSVDRYWTFYHEVVICTGHSDFHLVTISDSKQGNVVTHKFNWMMCLGATICNIYYYGNILFITTNSGHVYIYVIKDWSSFNLKEYDLKLYINGNTIASLDIQETQNEHRLIVAMNEYISQVFLYKKTKTSLQE